MEQAVFKFSFNSELELMLWQRVGSYVDCFGLLSSIVARFDMQS